MRFTNLPSGGWFIPNGCFDAYEVKVNKDIFKYVSGKGKTNLSIPEIFYFSMAS